MQLHRKNKKSSISIYEYKSIDGVKHLILPTDLKSPSTVSIIWKDFLPKLQSESIPKLILDASTLQYCDGIGIGLLFQIQRVCHEKKISLEIKGLKKEFSSLLESFSFSDIPEPNPEEERLNHIETLGYEFEKKLEDSLRLVEYIGEITSALGKSFRNPSKIRWLEVLKVSEQTGANALIIVSLIGFLLGLIMSFQSAIPMQRFGAEIFVANLVSLSLFRELGPLMTAIILAGRSGSSFAAEIGTMKVSEELDALNTMGLNPIQFLIIPKLISAMIVSPILTIFFNFFGLIGSAIVLMSFGYPLVTFLNQVSKTVKYMDMGGGLLKSFVFGLLIASIGCLSGLQTKEGASAVGESTTKAVVAGIIVIAVTDGIFSVFFFLLGI
jgi:phospholipid/cholesterol/gamma-HCH transport system permease protein